MHCELLVEEPSAEEAVRILWPKFGGAGTFKIIRHQGKQDLLKKLPGRLRGYRKAILPDGIIVVLIDSDCPDCLPLKAKLENVARDAGLVTKTEAGAEGAFQVVNRLAIHELEAWFFGDVEALTQAYPGVPPTLGEKARYRDPDSIPHAWETLERVLQKAGYYAGGMPKIEVARRIAEYMEPDRNRSRSFQIFRQTLSSFSATQIDET